jgi:hypothetical protein
MKTLKESILDDIDDALSIKNPYEVLYPLPTVKDFKKNGFNPKLQTISWQCPGLIKPYLNEIASITDCNYIPSKATGIGCRIDMYKSISTYLVDKYGCHIHYLYYIGDWVSDNMTVTKKECIKFFKTIVDNPETCFRKIIDYMRKQKQIESQYRVGNCITFDELFK